MLRFALQRSGQLLITLLGITVLTFGIMHLAPGEPTVVQSEMNPKVSAQAREQLRKLYGLDQPLWKQYNNWLVRLVRLDFGSTFTDGRPVTTVIAEKIPITLIINLLSLLLIVAVSLPVGVYAAVRHHSWFDKATTVFVFLGFAMPTFWLALLLMLLFGVYLGWLPISGYETLGIPMSFGERLIDWGRHLLLPVFVSAFGGLAGFSRYVRSSMLEVTLQDYIRTARAKGLDERTVVYKHAFRNALIPIVTLLGLSVPGLIGGSVIFETIYAIPGMGQLFYQAVTARDYPVVMGITVIGAILTLLGNFAADLSYALVNPKVKSAAGSGR
ncbi:MAG TPA: ABC transporter permease [Nitrospiria bacterium]|nr:ABC transporter permease [Nitrospiria bacterium]